MGTSTRARATINKQPLRIGKVSGLENNYYVTIGQEAFLISRHGDQRLEIEYYLRAIDNNYRSAQLYYNLGEAYLGIDQVDDAVQSFEAGLDADTDSADNHFGLGRAYQIRGQLEAAEAELVEAVRLAPGDLIFKEHLGLLYEQIGQPRKAIQQYQAILEIAPESEEVRERLKEINSELSRSDDRTSGMGGQ